MYEFGCEYSSINLKLVVNDLYTPSNILSNDVSAFEAHNDTLPEDLLNDSLVDAANVFRQNGGADEDSFVSAFDLLGVMSDSALQEAGDAASVFQSLHGNLEV